MYEDDSYVREIGYASPRSPSFTPELRSMRSMPLSSVTSTDRGESTISASGFTNASNYGYLQVGPSRSPDMSKRPVYETDMEGSGTDKSNFERKNISRSRLSFASIASGRSTTKPRKLLISGPSVNDLGAEPAIRKWCEVRRATIWLTMPSSSQSLTFRDTAKFENFRASLEMLCKCRGRKRLSLSW